MERGSAWLWASYFKRTFSHNFHPLARGVEGTYGVEVDGLRVFFRVKVKAVPPPPPPLHLYVVVVIIIVVVVAIAAMVLARTQRVVWHGATEKAQITPRNNTDTERLDHGGLSEITA
jgi:hypothetical protein